MGQTIGGRENQEDSCAIHSDKSLIFLDSETKRAGIGHGELTAVLCDGMGGHSGGEIAAGIAVEWFIAISNSLFAEGHEVPDVLLESLLDANEAIRQKICHDCDAAEMGTTLVGIRCMENRLNWISVGDSHLLLFRHGKLIKLNQDHSMRPVIDRMVERGMLTRDEAISHPERNALRSALTGDKLDLIDRGLSDFPLRFGDILLLASDGLDVVPQAVVCKLLALRFLLGSTFVVDRLLRLAKKYGGSMADNTTVALIQVSAR